MTQFTVFGVLVLVVVFLSFGQGGRYSDLIVTFLAVVLLSMIVLNWGTIRPLFLKED